MGPHCSHKSETSCPTSSLVQTETEAVTGGWCNGLIIDLTLVTALVTCSMTVYTSHSVSHPVIVIYDSKLNLKSGFQPVKKFSVLQRFWRLITTFTRPHYLYPSHFLNIHFNIISPSVPSSHNWSLFPRFYSPKHYLQLCTLRQEKYNFIDVSQRTGENN